MARSSVSSQRPSAISSTSSAFSPYAYPNEDWTKISDLAERRRIQNRIAQRNYRQKLKRRLEDLERRAFSTSTSPEPSPKQKPQRPQQSRAKSNGTMSTKTGWSQQSPTPSLRHSVSSFDEEVTLSHYGYGLPSPGMERTTLSSYSMNEQTPNSSSASYAQEPWYQNTAPNSYSSYTAWNANSTPMYASGQSGAHVKEEQHDDDLHAYSFSNYGQVNSASSFRGAASYQGSSSQSYTPSLSSSIEESFTGSFTDSPKFLDPYPTPPPSIAADDTFFSSAIAQAFTVNDPFLPTPSYEMGNDEFDIPALS